jgi:holin-like protein
MFLPQLRSQALAVTTALVASVVLTIAVPALVLRLLARGDSGRAKAPDEQ